MKRSIAGLLRGRKRIGRVLAFVDLVQDIDVLAPVLETIREDGSLKLKVVVSRWLATESPRTLAILAATGFDPQLVRRRAVIEGKGPSLRGVDLVITAAESSHPAHAAAHALALRARAAGVVTATLQHGLENVGLTGPGTETFASDHVLCWFAEGQTPAGLAPATRAKLLHTGRAVRAAPSAAPSAQFEVGVFENLHAEHYDDGQRARFAEGLQSLAATGARILVRPHPAGGWGAEGLAALASLDNVTVMDPEESRINPEPIAAVLGRVKRVVTTPSTIALDAAMAGRPVWLATAGGVAYRGLATLTNIDDWRATPQAADRPGEGEAALLARAVLPGDARPRVLAAIKSLIEGRHKPHPLPSGFSSD